MKIRILKRGAQGFTLVELLLVISIISMFSSIVLASVGSVRARARDARRKQDIRNIYNAVYLAAQNGIYPLADQHKYEFLADGQPVYRTAATSNDGHLESPEMVPWQDLENAVGSKLSRDPLNTEAPLRRYTYITYSDANGRPLTLYYRATETGCGSYIAPPGIPFQGMIYAAYLEATPGNLAAISGICPTFNPETTGKIFRLFFDGA